jgi:hypothetical protein
MKWIFVKIWRWGVETILIIADHNFESFHSSYDNMMVDHPMNNLNLSLKNKQINFLKLN